MSTTDSQQPYPLAVGSDDQQERRPQADPLPSKRGEIGYVEGAHELSSDQREDATTLPARHPADRDQPPPAAEPIPDLEAGNAPASSTPAVESESSSSSITKSSKLLGFLKPKTVPSFGGIQLTTILVFVLQLFLLGGTIVAWVFATNLLKKVNGQSLPTGESTSVFVHVIFVIAVIGELIFLERRIYHLRAERYSHLHPGEVLPRHRTVDSPAPRTAIAFAPWNRPPLPTYAATLAQSGVGTGDVEDHLIAAAPPPAYGNTRGSTLLLAGYLRESLRAQRPSSAHSETTPSRPMTYVSRDEDWEEIQDAERARQLEVTLNRLERSITTSSSQISERS